jgi:hypothetical protein
MGLEAVAMVKQSVAVIFDFVRVGAETTIFIIYIFYGYIYIYMLLLQAIFIYVLTCVGQLNKIVHFAPVYVGCRINNNKKTSSSLQVVVSTTR